jgi:hypothetical protein
MIVFASDKLVDFASGTNLGDMTGGGGINAALDNDVTTVQASCATKAAATSGYAGRTLAGGTVKPYRAFCYGSSDAGYVSAINPTVTLNLYGKSGSTAPVSAVDGTLIGTVSFTDTANESATLREIVLSVTSLDCQHIWVQLTHNGAANTIGIAEIIVYSVWSPSADNGIGFTQNHPIVLHDNVVTTSNVASTTAETGNPVTNLGNSSTSLKWRGTSVVADEYMTVTTTAAIDCIAVARHNFATGGILVSVEARTVSDHQYIVLIAPFSPANDGPLIMRFEARSDVTSIRIRLQPGTQVPEAAVLYLGTAVTLQRKLYVGHQPITMGRETNAVAALSESGEFLGRIILGQHSQADIALQNLTADWVRTYLDPFLQDALEAPFFFAWRPGDYPNETALAWCPPGTHPKPQNQRANGMLSISIPIMGITT